jgi:hypothetical protein
MRHKDLFGLYVRLGMVVAAFALIVGIIGAPVLRWLWHPTVIMAQR